MVAGFRPYRSEIDNGQFLVQPIAVHSFPAGLTAATSTRLSETAHFAASLGREICAHVETVQQKIGSRTHGMGLGTYVFKKRELRALLKAIGPSARDSEDIEDQRLLKVQPLFRAVAIVLRGSDFDVFTEDISQIPVLLVLTGIEEGLSTPITFDRIADRVVVRRDQSTDSVQSAETTLSTAVGFLIDLEQRELAAIRSKPDLYNEPTHTLFVSDQTLALNRRRYGWEAADVPKGSSANWVDTDIYQEWTGEGADYGEGTAQDWEKRARKFAYAAAQGEDLWKWTL